MCVYQLKVRLLEISPMIWRRLLVPGSTDIAELHRIIQMTMGWEDAHLHRFVIYGKEYGISYDGGIGFSDNPRKVWLKGFEFRVGDKFHYEYDLGDRWEHEIRVEAILELDPLKPYPICTAGNGACPPEDCGGPWAYIRAFHGVFATGLAG